MNKPSWHTAPDWAEYLAMDASGDWYWYEFEPVWDCGWEYWGRTRIAMEGTRPHKTLEKRP